MVSAVSIQREMQAKNLSQLVDLHLKRQNHVSSSNLVDIAYQYIIKGIRAGTLASGQKIVEAQVAKTLNISSIPVREAMARLQQEGWVVRVPNKGISVRKTDINSVKDLFHIRRIIETGVIGDVVNTINEEQLDELNRLVGVIEGARESEASDVASEADTHFHRLLVHFSGNARLNEMYEAVLMQATGFFFILCGRFPALMNLMKELRDTVDHRQIYQAIADGDVLRAQNLINEHISIAYKCMIEIHDAGKYLEQE